MTPENTSVESPALEAEAPEGQSAADLQPSDYATGFVTGYLRAQGIEGPPSIQEFRAALAELSKHMAEIKLSAH